MSGDNRTVVIVEDDEQMRTAVQSVLDARGYLPVAYGNAEEHDRKVAAEADKLAREANSTAYERWMGERKQGETERHNTAAEKQAAANANRTKFVPAGQYMGEDGIYRPVVMDQSTGRLVDPGTGKGISPDAKIIGQKDSGFTEEEAKDIARRFVVSGDVTDMQGIGPAARLKVTRSEINS